MKVPTHHDGHDKSCRLMFKDQDGDDDVHADDVHHDHHGHDDDEIMIMKIS